MQEERIKILNMVKEGKLTVNEALVLLDQLGSNDAKESIKKEEDFFKKESSGVHFEEAKKEDNYSYQKYQSTKDKFFDFIDTALKKIKDLEIDINFGKSIDITHIFEQNEVYLTRMDVDLANGSVKILPWDQKSVRVECDAKMYRVHTEEEARNVFLKNVVFAIEGQKLRFSTEQKWMKLNATFYVPKEQYESIKIRMFNGAINSENLHVDKYYAKTANGKIDLYGLEGSYVEAETANGKIDIQKGKIGEVDAETINGSIHMDGSFRKLELQSFNGNINAVIHDDNCEMIEAKATTGAVKLQLPEKIAIRGEAKTNLGNFNIDYIGLQITEEKNDVIQKQVRFEPVDINETAIKIEAETTTGTITIKRT